LEKNNVMKQEPEICMKLNNLLMEHIQKGGSVSWQKHEK
jgi:hypothetical protein